jgi:hypothetical protein
MLVDLLISLACISAGLSFLILIDQYRKEAKDEGVWGDFPHLPEGLRGHGGKPGGGGDKAAPAQVRTVADIARHRDGAVTK